MPESPEIAALAKTVSDGLDRDEEAARALARPRRGEPVPRWVATPGGAGIDDTEGVPRVKFAWARERKHILRHDPHRVLADVAARRTLLDEALGWKHRVTEDRHYVCLVATVEHDGGASSDRDDSSTCDCGRDVHVRAVLTALAAPYQTMESS